MLAKINIKISVKDKKSKALIKSIETTVNRINQKIEELNKNSEVNALIFRELEILIDNLVCKISDLEKKYNIDLSDKQSLLGALKKQVTDNGLEFAQSKSETLDEALVSQLAIKYLNHISKKDLVLERFNNLDEEILLQYVEVREKRFSKSLVEFVLNNDSDAYKTLCENAFSLHLLLGEKQLNNFRDSRKFIENIKYVLSTKQDNDFQKLENLIEDARSDGKKDDLKKSVSEIGKKWLNIADGNAKIDCVSLNNNFVFKLTHKDTSFAFMCSKLPLKSKLALAQLQQSTAKKYLIPEWYVTSFDHVRSEQKYQYNLTPWLDGNYEDFAIEIMHDDYLSLEDKQRSILTELLNPINMTLDFRAEGVVFSDIKPGNFLRSKNVKQLFLGDWKAFFKCNVNEPSEWDMFDITNTYIPPEQVTRGNRTYAKDVCEDIERQQTFMFGIVLYQMMHGWNASEIAEVMANAATGGPICYTDGKCHLEFNEANFAGPLGHKIKTLIQMMVNPEQALRLSLYQVINEINEYLASNKQLASSLGKNIINHSFSSPLPEEEIYICELPNIAKGNSDPSIEKSWKMASKPTIATPHEEIVNWKNPSKPSKLEKQNASFFHRDGNEIKPVSRISSNQGFLPIVIGKNY